MPFYNTNPLVAPPVKLLVAGKAEYLFGSLPRLLAQMVVTNVALTSNVATLTVGVIAGDIPAVGDLISVQGTQQASGAFNVSAVVLTGVTINKDSGVGTVTFALTHANVTSVADSGAALTTVVEASEAISNGNSIPFTVEWSEPETSIARTVTCLIKTAANTLTGTVTAQLAGALRNEDSDYYRIGTAVSIPTTAQNIPFILTLANWRFYRLNVSGITGGAGTIIAKVM
jgi:hypothetical protein